MRSMTASRIILCVLTGLLWWSAANVQAQSCGTAYSYHKPAYSYSTYKAPSYKAQAYKETYEEYEVVVRPRFLLAFKVADFPSYGAAYLPPHTTSPTPSALAPSTQAPTSPVQPARGNESQMQQILSAQSQILTELKSLGEKVSRVEERVGKLERTYEFRHGKEKSKSSSPEEGPAPKLESDDVDQAFIKVNNESCSMCHSRSNAGKYGNDFIFGEDDGRINPGLTADQREEVERQINPPDGKPPHMPKVKGKRAEETNPKPLNQQSYISLARGLEKQKLAASKVKKAPQTP